MAAILSWPQCINVNPPQSYLIGSRGWYDSPGIEYSTNVNMYRMGLNNLWWDISD